MVSFGQKFGDFEMSIVHPVLVVANTFLLIVSSRNSNLVEMFIVVGNT